MAEHTIKEYLSIYGTGTRVETPDGLGLVRAIYEYKCLVMLDQEFRMKARYGRSSDHLPAPIEYWDHAEPHHYFGCLYAFEEIKLILRHWSELKPQEIEAMDWDNQSMYWAKKSKKGIISFDIREAPQTLRPNEYIFLCSLKIDLFNLKQKGIAIYNIENK